MCWSLRIFDSIKPCSSLAAWYSAFSLRSPCSRATLIFSVMRSRPMRRELLELGLDAQVRVERERRGRLLPGGTRRAVQQLFGEFRHGASVPRVAVRGPSGVSTERRLQEARRPQGDPLAGLAPDDRHRPMSFRRRGTRCASGPCCICFRRPRARPYSRDADPGPSPNSARTSPTCRDIGHVARREAELEPR